MAAVGHTAAEAGATKRLARTNLPKTGLRKIRRPVFAFPARWDAFDYRVILCPITARFALRTLSTNPHFGVSVTSTMPNAKSSP